MTKKKTQSKMGKSERRLEQVGGPERSTKAIAMLLGRDQFPSRLLSRHEPEFFSSRPTKQSSPSFITQRIFWNMTRKQLTCENPCLSGPSVSGSLLEGPHREGGPGQTAEGALLIAQSSQGKWKPGRTLDHSWAIHSNAPNSQSSPRRGGL